MDILIIKTGALGDVVRTSFLAQALKDKYSKNNPHIFWVTSDSARSFFLNNPYIYRVIPENQKTNLKTKKFDLVINLEEDEENCKFASSLNCSRIIGFVFSEGEVKPTKSAKEWFDMSALGEKPQNDILKKKNKKTHRQILGEIVGVDYQKFEPFIRLTNIQRRIAQNFLRRHNLSRTDLIIGINTGSADRWPKQLSVEKTSKLIDMLSRKFNATIFLFGGPNEISRNQDILKKTKTPIITTGCGNDLVEFPALISLCSIFITTDSLGLHLALALKRKTICLIGPTSHSEIDLYDLGEKVIAKSNCICCYKSACNSMKKISLEEIVKKTSRLLNQKITVVITAFNEPKIVRAIKCALNQKTNKDFEVIVSAPDKKTIELAEEYKTKYKNFEVIKDPGRGKSFALNKIFQRIHSGIVILTDGDVYLSENSIEDISNLFLDPEVGAVSGRPTPQEERNSRYGYWAHILFDAAHKIRKRAFESSSFIECSGYLFAFRAEKISQIPLDVAEDTIIPYFLWEKGYKIGYAEEAKAFVKSPSNLGDWIKQKVRTSKAHERLGRYVDTKITPKVKSFKTESRGIFSILRFPQNLREFLWTLELIFVRLYMWGRVFTDTKIFRRHYGDAWERVESTK